MIPRMFTNIRFYDAIKVLMSIYKNEQEVLNELRVNLENILKVKHIKFHKSGTEALVYVLKAINVENKEVIVPAYTCASVVKAVLMAGAKVKFVDVDLETYNISPESLEERITGDTKAIVVIHMFGNPADMDSIMKIAKRNGLYVIEDAAQALGATYKGKPIGTLGDAAIFSLGIGKGIGYSGGVSIFNLNSIIDPCNLDNSYYNRSNFMDKTSSELAAFKDMVVIILFSSHLYNKIIRTYLEYMLKLKDKGLLIQIEHLFKGEHYNIKAEIGSIPKISALVANERLKKIRQIIEIKRKNARLLRSYLENTDVHLQEEYPEGESSYTRFCLLLRSNVNRELLRNYLCKRGIDTEEMYPYIRKLLQICKEDIKRFPNALYIAERNITLPIHTWLREEDIKYIAFNFLKALHELS